MTGSIVTSRSAVAAYQTCPRKRWLAYEAENSTPVKGWERRALAIPLVTGIYVHRGLEMALEGVQTAQAATLARDAYLEEVNARGLQVEAGTDEASVVEEQAAHVEALVLAWCRVRLPRWLSEYEIVEVEAEDRVPLSDDVTLAVRADAIVRRKADGRMFVVNFKTVAQADERWLKGWEVDMQLMTELLAAERRHGHEFGGVIIEGLVKGRRVQEKDNVGTVTGYRDTSPLLYGYKVDADPPLVREEYAWEYTKRKGWHRFPTWREPFTGCEQKTGYVPQAGWNYPSGKTEQMAGLAQTSPLSYWINWLPEEVVESQFVTVPPIMRDERMIASKVRQIVSIERSVKAGVAQVEASELSEDPAAELSELDFAFPQNDRSCIWPSACPMYQACWVHGVREDMAGSGLYRPRVDHHAVEGASE